MSNEVINKAPAKNTAAYTHKFAEPFTYGEKTYEELTFNFGALKCGDSLAVEEELALLGKGAVLPEYSSEYLIRIAARACTAPIGADAFNTMGICDFIKIKNQTRSFLTKQG